MASEPALVNQPGRRVRLGTLHWCRDQDMSIRRGSTSARMCRSDWKDILPGIYVSLTTDTLTVHSPWELFLSQTFS